MDDPLVAIGLVGLGLAVVGVIAAVMLGVTTDWEREK
jgi:hypothetical protein